MNYKPDEKTIVAYLYGELEGEERIRFEQYLESHPETLLEYNGLNQVSKMLRQVKDKEVIAPPIFVGDNQRSLWSIPYFKTIMSIAASLIIILLVAKLTNTRLTITDSEVAINFGNAPQKKINNETPVAVASVVTMDHVQEMSNQSLQQNNDQLHSNWKETQVSLENSIRKNMMFNSDKMDDIVRKTSAASKEQIEEYVATLQIENRKLVKDYFSLTAGEQKQYIEGLLVDFAKYLNQQRSDDLQLMQVRLNSLEQNTSVFKQETEQILTSIISTVGNAPSGQTKY